MLILAVLQGAKAVQASTAPEQLLALKQSVISNYARIAAAGYEDALAGVRALAESVDAFLKEPTADSLNRTRKAWIDARIPYVQTEAYRFYDGPIEAVEGLINAWPIDENLIDYVDGEPDAGIINHPDRFPVINEDLIVSLNEKDGEKNITAGFHAIEFLLWGQDLDEAGPGKRSYRDYVDAPHADRRRDYLRLTAALLVQHLEVVVAAWAPGDSANYHARFVAMPPDEALASILKGIGILSGAEMAGERLTVPYETKEQEDEHSCFSDNTQRDVISDAIGIENVIRGHYVRSDGTRIEGPGIVELLSHLEPPLAVKLGDQAAATIAVARLIPDRFDRAILGADAAPGRVVVQKLIAAFRAQSDAIAGAGAALGLRLNF